MSFLIENRPVDIEGENTKSNLAFAVVTVDVDHFDIMAGKSVLIGVTDRVFDTARARTGRTTDASRRMAACSAAGSA
jgi:hypothetical protein